MHSVPLLLYIFDTDPSSLWKLSFYLFGIFLGRGVGLDVDWVQGECFSNK